MSKVKVPAVFDKWYKQVERNSTVLRFKDEAMFLIVSQGFGYWVAGENNILEIQFDLTEKEASAMRRYVFFQKEDAMRAILDGYEVEKEKKYRIPMPQVTNGRGNNLYLSIHKDILRIAGLQNTDSWTQSFTAEDIEKLPEVYRNEDIFPRVEVKEDEP